MAEILKNTGAKLWSMVDDHDELQSNVFDQLFGTGGKSDIRLIDEAIGKINESLNGYYFKIINDKLYICKDTESGTTSLPLSITDDDGHVALKVDGTSITIDGNGVVHGANIDDAFSLTSENAVQNKVVKAKFDEVDGKINANETTILSHTTAINTLNGDGNGSVKKTVTDEIAKVVADAPESLDTLKEISDWISSHESDASAMNSAIQTNKSDIATLQTDKVDKETGKSLLADMDKVNYDDAVSKAHKHNNKSVLDKISETNGNLTYDGNEIKAAQMIGATSTTNGASGTVPAPKAGQENLFLRGDGTWGDVAIDVDDVLSDTSENPVQNKVVTSSISDTKDSKVTFTSNDTLAPTEFSEMPSILASKETHASLFSKISTVFKNMRYIIGLLGSTDISKETLGIGDSTVTGAIKGLNESLTTFNTMLTSSNSYATSFPTIMKWRNITKYENDCNKATDMGVYLTLRDSDSGYGLTANLPNFLDTTSRCTLVTFSVNNSTYCIQICMNHDSQEFAYRMGVDKDWKIVS